MCVNILPVVSLLSSVFMVRDPLRNAHHSNMEMKHGRLKRVSFVAWLWTSWGKRRAAPPTIAQRKERRVDSKSRLWDRHLSNKWGLENCFYCPRVCCFNRLSMGKRSCFILSSLWKMQNNFNSDKEDWCEVSIVEWIITFSAAVLQKLSPLFSVALQCFYLCHLKTQCRDYCANSTC